MSTSIEDEHIQGKIRQQEGEICMHGYHLSGVLFTSSLLRVFLYKDGYREFV